MIRRRFGLAAAILSACVGHAYAQDAAALAQSKGCTACHDLSQTKMGPSFQAIAAQYKGQADAATKLVAELKNGSNGHVKIDATDAELQRLVGYVLAAH